MSDATKNHDAPLRPQLPEPHAGQKKLLALPGRYRVAICGRRFGKTVAAAVAAVKHCTTATTRQRVWWLSPIQEQSDRVEREIVWWLTDKMKRRGTSSKKKSNLNAEDTDSDDLDSLAYWEHHKSEHALVYAENGSRIEFHSAHDPDHLRGAGLDLVIIDEAADVSEYTWKNVIKPMLLEAHGRAFVLGTPRGTHNWLHRLFLLGQQPEHAATYSSIQLPTTANPRIPKDELESYRLEMTELEFRQEFEAEFIDGADSIFTNVLECVDGKIVPEGRRGETYITGIDLGEHKDYTVLCSINLKDRQMEGFWRFHQVGWAEQADRISDHLKRFPGPCVIDRTGVGDVTFQQLHRQFPSRVFPFIFTAQRKNEIVKGLAMGFEKKCIKIAKVPELIAELQVFRCLDTGLNDDTRYKRYGAPSGLHDDCVMSLALAWWGVTGGAVWGAANPSGNALKEGLFA